MSIEQLRLAIVALLIVVVGVGGYLAWHVTHQHTGSSACYVGGARYDPCH
jgi:hypothetical protein